MKKPLVKKKILESDQENEDEDDMEVDESKDNSNNCNIDPDLTPSSPRPSSSRGTRSGTLMKP